MMSGTVAAISYPEGTAWIFLQEINRVETEDWISAEEKGKKAEKCTLSNIWATGSGVAWNKDHLPILIQLTPLISFKPFW